MNIVKELRKKANIQQKELAISIGVSRPTVSEWESNKKDPSGERLKKLAEFFGVDELMILGKGVIDYTKQEDKPKTITARIVSGIDKMPEEQQQRILAGLCNMFPDYFMEGDENGKA